jgi:hypothetical protein
VQTPGARVTTSIHNVTHVVNGVHVTLPETVNHIGTFARIFGAGVYSELIWALAIVIVLQTVLTFTRWGLYTVSVGSNKLGAAEAAARGRASRRASDPGRKGTAGRHRSAGLALVCGCFYLCFVCFVFVCLRCFVLTHLLCFSV